MSAIRISEAATLLGVSDDTVRRWIAAGELPATSGEGVTTVDGAALAEIARRRAQQPADDGSGVLRSARQPVHRPGHRRPDRHGDGQR